jgi:hypothetical protein
MLMLNRSSIHLLSALASASALAQRRSKTPSCFSAWLRTGGPGYLLPGFHEFDFHTFTLSYFHTFVLPPTLPYSRLSSLPAFSYLLNPLCECRCVAKTHYAHYILSFVVNSPPASPVGLPRAPLESTRGAAPPLRPPPPSLPAREMQESAGETRPETA